MKIGTQKNKQKKIARGKTRQKKHELNMDRS